MSKDIRDIVAEWLETNGYDGLAGDACGCLLSDIMPCDYPSMYDCVPGYKVPCPGGDECPADGDCDWHVVEHKPQDYDAQLERIEEQIGRGGEPK